MKSLVFTLCTALFFVGCMGGDISSLSKKECIKKGFVYKVKKRFNYREGEFEIKSICVVK